MAGGRPRGSKNKPKATPAKGGPGHNSGNAGDLDDDHQQALHIKNHVPSYERALKAKKEADAAFKNVCKTIKSEGGSVVEIKRTIELRTPEGEAKLKSLMEAMIRTARWSGLAIGTQTDMFGTDSRPLRERAFDEGKRIGMAGEACNVPANYSPGTDGEQGWIEGWHRGQEVLTQGILKKPTGTELLKTGAQPPGPDSFDEDEAEIPPPVGEQGGGPPPDGTPWPDDAQVAGLANGGGVSPAAPAE